MTIKIFMFFDPVIPLIVICPKKNVGKAVYPHIFIGLPFIIVEKLGKHVTL